MWALKVIKGPQQGQIIRLKNGPQTLGRTESTDHLVKGQGISKDHAKIDVSENEIKISDLGSRNGTFVNGVKVKTRSLKIGDRIALHDVILELMDENGMMTSLPSVQMGGSESLEAVSDINRPQDSSVEQEVMAGGVPFPEFDNKNILDVARNYFETVVLPGIYKLAQTFEYRWVLAMFVFLYVIVVTGLSVVPMLRVMKTSLERESQRRASTIAQGLSDRYLIALSNGTAGSFDVRFAEKEEGVTAAFILSASDGSIVAPVSRSGAYANEPFVHTARKQENPLVQQINDELIGASVPIRLYDPETGMQATKAYAMVLYNMGSLAVDDGRVISLFTQVLGIALLIGIFLFVFLYRLVQIPVANLSYQIDRSIRLRTDKVESPYLYPTIQTLVLNINSLLARAQNSPDMMNTVQKDIYSEATHLVRIMQNPAFAVDSSGLIIAINSALASELNVSLSQLDSTPINALPNDAITGVAAELIGQVNQSSNQLISSPIHINNKDLELNLQPIKGSKGIEYIIFTVTDPKFGEEAA